ncbi:alpha/beta hydrolase [Mucilaginibacter sp. SMC90]|uniref:alpha/beta fold hydrolase n=1 Tax=Mucilaginibacter sp. SMC90 TaxID=2929803 RepID=UPI001FB39279|nr:alpha/beta fold hydrolase [Mucilaginibacter sp. SMC90]UOE46232.1 alpha/beta hydrolase [Mucilaginibacter sp. SMC90]
MPHLLSNNINIYYEIHGQGFPLILVSGLGGDRTFWQASIEPLSAQFRVIIFDTRGIGRTDAPEEAYSMELFADDLAGLMDALQISQAHILGFSMGGQIALQFALKYPQKIDKLIIAASCAKLNTQIRLYVDAVLEVYEGGITTKQMFELIAPWLFSNSFLSVPGNEAYLQYDENDPEQQPLYAWRNQYLAQRAFDATPKLKDVKAGPLIITGELDVFAQLSDAMALHEGLSGSTLKIIPGAGHLFNFEQPKIFHDTVINYLNS